jgi:hypothetical protein
MEFIKETTDWKVLKADWKDRVSNYILCANIQYCRKGDIREQVVETAGSGGGGREADG